MFLSFSSKRPQSGKRVLYNRGTNTGMPESPVLSALFGTFVRPAVHLDEQGAARKTQSAARAAALCLICVKFV
jgi:hypothetical protein